MDKKDKTVFKATAIVYLATLGGLTLWFIGHMAMANPQCSNCSVSLVQWALPWSEALGLSWMFAGTVATGVYRKNIATTARLVWQMLRRPIRVRKMTAAPTAE